MYDPQGIREDVFAYASDQARAVGATKAPLAQSFTITLAAASWSAEAPYTQTAMVDGLTNTDRVFGTVVLSDDVETAQAEREAWNMVSTMDAAKGAVSAVCWDDLPQTDIVVRLEALG